MQLTTLLHKTFGFSAFRANQEAVCRAATDGRDVLLVMPTGAGKRLCYQLPANARGGTALVISPLIALMDDEAAKLSAAGLRLAGFCQAAPHRKPALVADDEAHCISGWGHDFRPDYRPLGETLPLLRPAPIIALTATATPVVQQDIVAQLSLDNPALFIHGFRRDNLAIEIVELSKPRRNEFILDYLKPEA